VEKGVGKEKE
jgi:hypothetical protein